MIGNIQLIIYLQLQTSNMSNLSLLLLTKNESENLKEWGNWIPHLTAINEIVVVDDESTDDTIKILKSLATKNLSVKIFDRKLDNNFSEQRNFGLSKCQNDWVLFLDPDEVPTSETIDYINKLSPKKGENYSFKRNIIYLSHTVTYGQCLNDFQIKLFNRHEGKFINPVHEIWKSPAKTINTCDEILHYSIKDLSSFLQKINHYSSIRAQELHHQGHHPKLIEVIFYPFFKFHDLFIFKLGFLDGIPGLILSLSLALNSFLIRAKLWHLSQK